MQYLHRRAETSYQCPILIAVRFKSGLSLLEYPKDGIRRIQKIEPFGRGMVSEIDSGLLSVVIQRIGD